MGSIENGLDQKWLSVARPERGQCSADVAQTIPPRRWNQRDYIMGESFTDLFQLRRTGSTKNGELQGVCADQRLNCWSVA
jgi:hypothetical protein